MTNIIKFTGKKNELASDKREDVKLLKSGLIAQGVPRALVEEVIVSFNKRLDTFESLCEGFELDLPKEMTKKQMDGLSEKFKEFRATYADLQSEVIAFETAVILRKWGYL